MHVPIRARERAVRERQDNTLRHGLPILPVCEKAHGVAPQDRKIGATRDTLCVPAICQRVSYATCRVGTIARAMVV